MRALVVEDEDQPRNILRDLVPWGNLGFEKVATAKNGLEALDVLEAGDIDLVLTDVRMPKLDGVGLALEVRRRWPGCILLFLSGFSDKEYLKTAIRVQAQDYLEKPIDLDQVSEAVATAAKTILQRNEARNSAQRDGQVLQELLPFRRQAQAELLLGLGLAGDVTLEERFSVGPYRVFILAPQVTTGPEWRSKILSLVNAESGSFPGLAAGPEGPWSVAVVADGGLGSDPHKFDETVDRLLGAVNSTDSSVPVRIGVAPAVPDRAGLAAALLSAKTALIEGFYRPDKLVHQARTGLGRALDFPVQVKDSWQTAMVRKDYPELVRLLEQLDQRSQVARDPDLSRVRAVWLGAMTVVIDYVPAWGPSEQTARLEKLRKDFEVATCLKDLVAQAGDCFSRLFLQSPGDLLVSNWVARAQLFVETRFADPDLTVEDIARHVGYSESYFCTVFKQAQNITVKDYVTKFRIDRAKAYLWEKDPPTLADLALKVGFRDPNYFGTVFRRLTGTTPGAYRKKALG